MPGANLRMYQNRVFIGEQRITEEQVRAAMQRYDREYPFNDYPRTEERPAIKTWSENEAYDYAIRDGGKCYPPKFILRLAISLDQPDKVDGFYGGDEPGNANWVLAQLGFDIILKSKCN